MEDLFEISNNTMKYLVIEERLIEPLRKKCEDYNANINIECWVQYKARRPIDRIQPYLISNVSINSRRALTLLMRSHKLGIEVAL